MGSSSTRERHGAWSSHPDALHVSQASESTRLNRVYEDVPLLLLEDDDVVVFADPDGVTVDDDLRTGDALRTERDPLHLTSPPFASMCGQITDSRFWNDGHASRMVRTPARVASRSEAFC